MTQSPPIVATITVTHHDARGVTALVDGKTHHFPDIHALFTAAVRLLEQSEDSPTVADAVQARQPP
jgi:hypothetical protein